MSMYDHSAHVVIATLRSALFEGYVLTPTDYSRGELVPQVSYLPHSGLLRDILGEASVQNKLVELMTLLDDLGIFKMWSAMAYTPQNPEYHPEGSVQAHMYMVLHQASEYGPIVKLGALVHDFGKPASYIEHGNTHDHHVSGLPYIEAFCDLFGVDHKVRALVTTVCEYHIRAHRVRELSAPKLLHVLKVLRYDDDEHWQYCMDIMKCDLLGRGGSPTTESIDYLNAAKDVLRSQLPERDAHMRLLKRFIRTRRSSTETAMLPVLPLNSHITTERRAWLTEQVDLQCLDVVAIVIVGSVNQQIDTPDSDLDIVCVYKPDEFGTAVNERPKSVDLKMELQFKSVMSLPDNIGKADHNTLDLLYAPTECLLYSTRLWDLLCKHRSHAVAVNMYGLTAGLNSLYYQLHGRDEELAVLTKIYDATVSLSVTNLHQLVEYVNHPRVYLTQSEDRKLELLYVLGKYCSSGIAWTELASQLKRRRVKVQSVTSHTPDTKAVVHAIRAAVAYLKLMESEGEYMALDIETRQYLMKLKRGQAIDNSPLSLISELVKDVECVSTYQRTQTALRANPDVEKFKSLIKEI